MRSICWFDDGRFTLLVLLTVGFVCLVQTDASTDAGQNEVCVFVDVQQCQLLFLTAPGPAKKEPRTESTWPVDKALRAPCPPAGAATNQELCPTSQIVELSVNSQQ